MKVLLIGYGEMASSLMLGVLESGHKLVGVLRWEKAKDNKILYFLKNIFWPDKLTTLIKSYKIHEINLNKANSEEFKKQVLKLNPDIILVGSWGEIFKKDIIMLPTTAFINCHPSLLPRYRGSNPYSSAIIAGETKTGITFHLVDENIDSGPILLQKEVQISNDDNAAILRTKCAYKAKEGIIELLGELDSTTIIPVNQDKHRAFYVPRLTQKDTRITWNKSPQDIYNRIRGLNPWQECYTIYKNNFLIVKSSKIIDLAKPESKAGKIIKKRKNSLLVSTINPEKAILLEKVYVYGFLSFFWSGLYIRTIKIGEFLR